MRKKAVANIYVQNKKPLREKVIRNLKNNWILYVMILPVLVYFAIFSYGPMYGILLAFKDYKIKLGILGSPWVGFKHFQRFFESFYFKTIVKNTIEISLYGLIAGFPIPIIFALLLNYLKYPKLKKTIQMVSYAPYFISVVIMCGMIHIFCDLDIGIFNVIRESFGLERLNFLAVPQWFKDIYTWSGIWQGMGWSAIIYMSALAGVDQELHEAAIIDGAIKLQRIWHVDLPSIKPTIIMLLILAIGGLMGVGLKPIYYKMILTLQNLS